LVRAPNS